MIMKDEYAFLSNFYCCPITIIIEGQSFTFSCVEAAYQAHKNYSLAKHFVLLNGYEAKKYGKQIPLTTANWDIFKIYIMGNLLHIKFQNKELMNKLVNVNEPIVEDNYWNDIFWGVCTNRTYKHEGKNILGKLLTCIKDNNNDLNILLKYISDEIIKDLGNS